MELLARACVHRLTGALSTGSKPIATCIVCKGESYRRSNKVRSAKFALCDLSSPAPTARVVSLFGV